MRVLATILLGSGLVLSATAASNDPTSHFFNPDLVPAEDINKAMGAELFSSDPFWEQDERDVAKVLDWPEESRTEVLASYRLYADSDYEYFGARPYSCALYARDGKPMMLSLVYANKGDFFGGNDGKEDHVAAAPASGASFAEALENDATVLEAKLSGLLGKPRRMLFGKGSMQERVSRWDWNGVSFLLATPKNEYVGLRIISSEMADKDGVLTPLPDAAFKRKLVERIEERSNGDVVLTQIPMVDQGPKGYCTPATWERYLRYMDIPADMYVLAMAAGTLAGGGTYTGAMDESADRLAKRHKKRVEQLKNEMTLKQVSRQIDAGLPIMWACYVQPSWDRSLSARTQARARKSAKQWNKELEEPRERAGELSQYRLYGHMRMIIGYNKKTDEIAFTDSWGKGFEERWMTIEEAAAIHGRVLKIIKP